MPAFLNDLLQTKHFIDFDPWVTQRFPLGHPEFSTGSPKVFHWVTQALPGSCNSYLPTTTSQPSAERSHPRNTKPRLFIRGTTLRILRQQIFIRLLFASCNSKNFGYQR